MQYLRGGVSQERKIGQMKNTTRDSGGGGGDSGGGGNSGNSGISGISCIGSCISSIVVY
jgi:hypothetical protein